MALTKAEISQALALDPECRHLDSRALVDSFFEEIRNELAQGVNVKISGFGNFELRDKSPRPGRNPKTGIEVVIASRRVVTFKAGQKLKTSVTASMQERDARSKK